MNIAERISLPRTGVGVTASGLSYRVAMGRLKTAGAKGHGARGGFVLEMVLGLLLDIGDWVPRQAGSSLFAGETLR